MSDEKKRLSWREIDKLKDASGLAKLRRKLEKKDGSPVMEERRSKERYLKELEKLFSSKGNNQKEEALKKLHLSVGKRDFKKLLVEFYQNFGLPEEARDLILFLDSDSPEILGATFEKIREQFPQYALQEKQTLLAKLRTLILSLKDESLSFQVEKLLKELTL